MAPLHTLINEQEDDNDYIGDIINNLPLATSCNRHEDDNSLSSFPMQLMESYSDLDFDFDNLEDEEDNLSGQSRIEAKSAVHLKMQDECHSCQNKADMLAQTPSSRRIRQLHYVLSSARAA